MAMRRSRFQVKPNLKPGPKPTTPTKLPDQTSQKKGETPKKTLVDSPSKPIEKPTENKEENLQVNNTNKDITTSSITPGEKSSAKEEPINSGTDISSKEIPEKSKDEKSIKAVTRFRMIKPKPKLIDRPKTVQPPQNNPITIDKTMSNNSGSVETLGVENVIKENPANATTIPTTKNIQQTTSETITKSISAKDNNTSSVNLKAIPEATTSSAELPPIEKTPLVSTRISDPADISIPTSTTEKRSHQKPKQRRTSQRPKFCSSTPPERKKMKMMDLIFWNPATSPMKIPKPKPPSEVTATAAVQQEETIVDEPVGPNPLDDGAEHEDEVMPGPRLMIGDDGQIIIDETSLVIEKTAPTFDISKQAVVYETSDTTYASFKKPKRSLKPFWTLKETAKFYRALSLVGTDFTLMANIFPERTRDDLKKKYKREERSRQVLLDKALGEWHNFDLEDYENFLGFDKIEEILTEGEKVKNNKRKRKAKTAVCDENGQPKKVAKPRKKKKPGPPEVWSEEEVELEIPAAVIDSDQETVELERDEDEFSCLKTRTTKRQAIIDERKEIQADIDAERAALEDSVETLPYSDRGFDENEFNFTSSPRASEIDWRVVSPKKVKTKSPDVNIKGIHRLKSPRSASRSKGSPIYSAPNLASPESSSTNDLKNKSNQSQSPSNPQHIPVATVQRDYSSKFRNKATTSSAPVQTSLPSPKINAVSSLLKAAHMTPDSAPAQTSVPLPKINVISSLIRAPNKTPDGATTETSLPSPKKNAVSSLLHTANKPDGAPTQRLASTCTNVAVPATPKHPTLQAILNEASSALQAQGAGGAMTQGCTNINTSVGQLVLVARRTPSNEKVVHVYLVSPNTSASPNVPGNTPNQISNLGESSAFGKGFASVGGNIISTPPPAKPKTKLAVSPRLFETPSSVLLEDSPLRSVPDIVNQAIKKISPVNSDKEVDSREKNYPNQEKLAIPHRNFLTVPSKPCTKGMVQTPSTISRPTETASPLNVENKFCSRPIKSTLDKIKETFTLGPVPQSSSVSSSKPSLLNSLETMESKNVTEICIKNEKSLNADNKPLIAECVNQSSSVPSLLEPVPQASSITSKPNLIIRSDESKKLTQPNQVTEIPNLPNVANKKTIAQTSNILSLLKLISPTSNTIAESKSNSTSRSNETDKSSRTVSSSASSATTKPQTDTGSEKTASKPKSQFLSSVLDKLLKSAPDICSSASMMTSKSKNITKVGVNQVTSHPNQDVNFRKVTPTIEPMVNKLESLTSVPKLISNITQIKPLSPITRTEKSVTNNMAEVVCLSVTPGRVLPKASPSGINRPYSSSINISTNVTENNLPTCKQPEPQTVVPSSQTLVVSNVPKVGSVRKTFTRLKIQPNIKPKVHKTLNSSTIDLAAKDNFAKPVPSPIFPKPSPSGITIHKVKIPLQSDNIEAKDMNSTEVKGPNVEKSSIVNRPKSPVTKKNLDQLGIVKLNTPSKKLV